MQASASKSSSTSKMAGWAASRSSSVGSASLNGSSTLLLIISSCYFLMKISSFYTLLHGTRISPQTKTVAILQISPRVNDWGLIRTGGLFQNLGLHGGLFEYGGLIKTGGLNEDLRYIRLHSEAKCRCLLHYLSRLTIKKDGVDSSMSILKEFCSKCQISAPLICGFSE